MDAKDGPDPGKGSTTPGLWKEVAASLGSRFDFEHEIGRGGMARVFAARDLKHGRQVALKILDPTHSSEVGWQRFEREINVTSNLQHPHILPLLDSGRAGDFLYYVMPFVAGPTLRDRIRSDAPFPTDEALTIAQEVASALDYAHRYHLVHRDVKPENILLSDGHAIVTDFGVARLGSPESTALTHTGALVGTLTYMSPEQLAGLRVDRRSDVYGLACVTYEMLTGEPPFRGSLADLLDQHLGAEPPSVKARRPDLPDALDVCLRRALAKKPVDRFASPGEFVAALRSAVGGHSIAHPQPTDAPRRKSRSRRTWVSIAGGTGLVAAALLLIRGCAG